MEWLVPATVAGGVVEVEPDVDHADYELTSRTRFQEDTRRRPTRGRAR
jgi:hypothetical protein